jgi:hypothetical protein
MKKNFLFTSQKSTIEDYTAGLEYIGDIFGTNIWKDRLIAGR